MPAIYYKIYIFTNFGIGKIQGIIIKADDDSNR